MAKPNYYTRRAFTALAAGAVLAMLLLLVAAVPALADAGWGPTIDAPANNSVDNDGDIEFSGPSFSTLLGDTVDLYEDLPEGPNKVGTGTVWGIGLDCEAGCMYDWVSWGISLTGVADGPHTYYAVEYDNYGNVSDPSSTVTVVVDRSIPPTVDYFMPSPDGVTTKGPVGGVPANPLYEATPWQQNSVSAYFSKKMDPNTLTKSTFTLVKNESDGSTTPVDATVGYDPTRYSNWVYLKLPSFLEGATNYTATIKGDPDGAKDEFGNPLAEDYVWSFTTATWPMVDSVSPSDEAKEVTSSTDVEATFSKDMVVTPSTFTLVKNESDGSTTPVDATVYSSIKYYNGIATKTATLNPSSNLQATTKYTATLKGGPDGAKDTGGNPLAEDYVWSFTTTGDVTPPETSIVSGVLPNPSDNTPTFSFSGSDDVSAKAKLQYSYQVDGAILLSDGWHHWSDYSGQTSVTLSSLSDGGHVFSVRAKDEAGNVDETPASYSWTVDTTADTTAPVVKAPAHSLIAMTSTSSQVRLGTSTSSPPNSVPVRLDWSGQDTTGIASYELQQSTNGGAFANSPLSSPTDITKVVNLEPTKSYRFQVRATDTNGNVSTFAVGPSFTPRVDQESSSRIVDSGTWNTTTTSSASGGALQYASAGGRLATYSVPAGSTNVAWVSTFDASRGRAAVTLIENGVRKPSVTVDTYRASGLARSVVFAQALDPSKTYKVEVKVLGIKTSASTGTRVDVDAFAYTTN